MKFTTDVGNGRIAREPVDENHVTCPLRLIRDPTKEGGAKHLMMHDALEREGERERERERGREREREKAC